MNFEYIVYGGYDILDKAFSALPLIFNDGRTGALISGSYAWIYFSLVIIGVLFYFTSAKFNALTGQNVGIYDWLTSYWWAIVFFVVLIYPGGTIILRDESLNKDKTIENVPVGVVMAAGLTNQIEVGFKDIFETAMAPRLDYTLAGNGVGFSMMKFLYSSEAKVKFKTDFDRQNLDKYIDDCLTHAILVGGVSTEDIESNQDFITVLGNAAYASIFTLRYSNSNRQGETVSCADAYTNLQTTFTTTYWEDLLRDFCTEWGFSDAVGFQQCKVILEGHLSSFVGLAAPTASSIIMQSVIALRINDVIMSGSSSSAIEMIGARNLGNSGVGAGLMANEFVPIFRNIITAINIAMTPIVMLLMAMYGIEAFKYWIGTFIWIMLWGVVDVILNAFTMDYAYYTFQQIRNHELGYASLYLFNDHTTKVLSTMGYMRSFGAVLSMGIVSGVMRMGSSMASVAGSLQGKLDGAGQSAGHTALTVEGQSAKLKELEASVSAMPNFGGYGFTARTKAGTFQGATHYESSLSTIEEIGHGVSGGAKDVGGANAYNTGRMVADTGIKREKLGPNASKKEGSIDGASKAGSVEAAGTPERAFTKAQNDFLGGYAKSVTASGQEARELGFLKSELDSAAGRKEIGDYYSWDKSGRHVTPQIASAVKSKYGIDAPVGSKMESGINQATSKLEKISFSGHGNMGPNSQAASYLENWTVGADGKGTLAQGMAHWVDEKGGKTSGSYTMGEDGKRAYQQTHADKTNTGIETLKGDRSIGANTGASLTFGEGTRVETLEGGLQKYSGKVAGPGGKMTDTTSVYDPKTDTIISSSSRAGRDIDMPVNTSAPEGKAFAKSVSAAMRADGHTKFADDIDRRIDRGETISFKAQYDQAGNLATVRGSHGGEMYSTDVSSLRSEGSTTDKDSHSKWSGDFGGIAVGNGVYGRNGNVVKIEGMMTKGDKTYNSMLAYADKMGDAKFASQLRNMDAGKAIEFEIEGDRNGKIAEIEAEQESKAVKTDIGIDNKYHSADHMDKETVGGKKGERILGNSKADQEFIEKYNRSIQNRLSDEGITGRDAEILTDKMSLKPGDRITYTQAEGSDRLATWQVDRGGNVLSSFTAEERIGDKRVENKHRLERNLGSKTDGALTGALEQYARWAGASEETTKLIGGIAADAQATVGEVSGMVTGVKNLKSAGKGKATPGDKPDDFGPVPKETRISKDGGAYQKLEDQHPVIMNQTP